MNQKSYKPSTRPWPKNAAAMRAELSNLVAEGSLHPSNLQGRAKGLTFSHRCENAALGLLQGTMHLLPERLGLSMMRTISRWIGRLARSRSKEVSRRLQQAFPEKTAQERKRLLADIWSNIGQSMYEVSIYSRLHSKLAAQSTVIGAAAVQKLQAENRPLMILIAHQANWELTPPIIEPILGNLTYIFAAQSNPTQNLWALYRRTRDGATCYPRNLPEAPELLARDMLNGKPMIIALDHALRGPKIPFFGAPAHTGTGPLRIAQATGAAVIPLQIRRKPGLGALEFTFLPELNTGTKDQPRDRTEIMADYNRVLEDSISGAPAEWFWLHRRWKSISKPRSKQTDTAQS